MSYDFIDPSVQLPPVDCPLLIQAPAGSEIHYPDEKVIILLEDEAVPVIRRSHIECKEGQMDYWLVDGGKIQGRLPWTYP